MNNEKLAIFGGPRALTRKPRERWRRIAFRDLATIMYSGVRDINTVSDGGGQVKRFEQRFSALAGTKYAIAMNSGTASLHSAYFAVGVGPGSEVIAPAYTFYATVTPLLQLGAVPVFCDIDERTLTADPEDVEKLITPRTKAICVTHIWGNPAQMDVFVDIARRHRVALIEDASHAAGARYRGRHVGSWGDVGCFSLQGGKAVSGGECGVAVTDNPTLHERMLNLGHNMRTGPGMDGLSLGIKYRPHVFAVILANGGLRRLSELNALRRRNYAILSEELAGCPGLKPIETYPDAERGGWLGFLFKYDPEEAGGWSREAFVRAAQAEGVPLSIDRYSSFGQRWNFLPDSPLFNSLDTSHLGSLAADSLLSFRRNGPPKLPATRKLGPRLVSLPAFTKVSTSYVHRCGQALRKVLEGARGVRDLREP
jgi:dTDP-4-amino-4,6-dideoxygalactose transaminase